MEAVYIHYTQNLILIRFALDAVFGFILAYCCSLLGFQSAVVFIVCITQMP